MAEAPDPGNAAMMRPVGEVRVYLHRAPIDMRKGRILGA